jgi:hypothetical protein
MSTGRRRHKEPERYSRQGYAAHIPNTSQCPLRCSLPGSHDLKQNTRLSLAQLVFPRNVETSPVGMGNTRDPQELRPSHARSASSSSSVSGFRRHHGHHLPVRQHRLRHPCWRKTLRERLPVDKPHAGDLDQHDQGDAAPEVPRGRATLSAGDPHSFQRARSSSWARRRGCCPRWSTGGRSRTVVRTLWAAAGQAGRGGTPWTVRPG